MDDVSGGIYCEAPMYSTTQVKLYENIKSDQTRNCHMNPGVSQLNPRGYQKGDIGDKGGKSCAEETIFIMKLIGANVTSEFFYLVLPYYFMLMGIFLEWRFNPGCYIIQ
jgi:hypothetical protein